MEELPNPKKLMGLDDLRGQINWDPLEAEHVLNVVIHHLEKQSRKDGCLTYCKSDLRAWGWTNGAIKNFLGEPDTIYDPTVAFSGWSYHGYYKKKVHEIMKNNNEFRKWFISKKRNVSTVDEQLQVGFGFSGTYEEFMRS